MILNWIRTNPLDLNIRLLNLTELLHYVRVLLRQQNQYSLWPVGTISKWVQPFPQATFTIVTSISSDWQFHQISESVILSTMITTPFKCMQHAGVQVNPEQNLVELNWFLGLTLVEPDGETRKVIEKWVCKSTSRSGIVPNVDPDWPVYWSRLKTLVQSILPWNNKYTRRYITSVFIFFLKN